MTLTLTPETESRLRDRAAREGLDVSAFAEEVFAEVFADDPDDLTPEQISEIQEGIKRGLEAVEQGRERPLADYVSEVMGRRAARNAS